jgi:subtilisin family serine protease
MPKFVALAGAAILILAMSQPAVAQSPSFGDGAAAPAAQPAGFDQESETGLWIVTLDDASLAAYTGDIPGLAATSPSVTGAEGLDVDAPASLAYRNHLATAQGEFIDAMDGTLDRSVPVVHQYQNVLNGVAVEVSAAEAAQLAALPGVASVDPDGLRALDTDVSHALIGTAGFWDGETGPGLPTRGEGVVVGVLDSGVNASHPSFAAVSPGDGYVHENPFGSGNFVGACDPASPNHQPVCNDKLIGAYNFNNQGLSFPNVQDLDSHGSHTSSTAAGNLHDATFPVGDAEFTRTIQGVAPRANVISYKVCDQLTPGGQVLCPDTSSIAAVNQAIADGADALNYSIGGTDDPWGDLVNLAFLEAFEAGIFVASSAGNEGVGTVAKTGPWNATIAATTHQRIFAQAVDIAGAPELQGLPAIPGDGPQVTADIPAEIRFVEGNPTGCTAFPAGAFTGSIALIERGPAGCTFATKEANARAAGAIAVVIFNNQGGPPAAAGGLTAAQLPLVMIEQDTGQAVRDEILDNAPAPTQATIQVETELFLDPTWEDILAGFSSTGPSAFEVLAPTFAAPGVNVLAAGAADGTDANQYAVISGTSMASPHGAGSGALLASLHPDWSPAQIRSALAGTADPTGILKPDATTPADQFDIGPGRLDLAAAARVGLTLDETAANFAAANPATGGDPKTLNVPSFIDHSCAVCSWERTLTSASDAPASYTAVVDAPDGMTVTVTPSEFTVPAGGTVDIEVTVDASGLPEGEWAFADVRLETSSDHAGGQPIAAVHYPIGVIAAEQAAPDITVDPEEITATQGPDETVTHELTIGNTGNAPLNWSVFENAPTRSPEDPSSPVASEAPSGTPSGSASLAKHRRLLSGTFGPRPPTMVTPEAIPAQEGEITITHSASQDIVALNSVACSPDGGFSTTENGYLRHFTLDDFGITSDFAVSEVQFAIEDLTIAQTMTVNLFTMVDPAGPFVYANFQEVGSAEVSLTPQAMTLVSVPVTGTAPAGSTLVVEIDSPDTSGAGAFFIGSNPNGQTAPSYLRSVSCGLNEPTDTAAIGFPGMQIVMNVTGTADGGAPACEVPSGTPWVDVDPLAGTVAAGGGQVVGVTFDSTGLSAGDVLEANLCLESDDPDEPLVSVPLTLQVTEAPVIEVTPDALSAEQEEGEVTEQTLTIGNVGSGTLEWDIFADEPALPTGSTPAQAGTAAPGVTLGTNPNGEPGTSAVPEAAPLQAGETTITHSASQAIVELNSVGCTPGGGATTENGYLRHFTLDDFDITSDFSVTEVSFGIETINGPPHPTTVNLFTMINPAGPFTYTNFQPIGSAEQELPAQALTIVSIPVTGTAPAGSTLVVEIETPDMTTTGGGLFIGSNSDGQTAPSFIRSASCGIAEPTDLTAIGFPGMHIVMNVTGTTDVEPAVCDGPGDVPWLSVSPASGTTAAGESSDVTVSFDSTGLAVGEHVAVLCVTSNDPVTPLVQVPVILTVVEDGGGEPVVCDETITGTHAGALTVAEGVTCLAAGSRVLGEVNVLEGAGLVATAAVVQGPVSAVGATVVEVVFSQVTGPVLVSGATESVSLFASQVTGSVTVLNSGAPSTVSGNTIIGSLSCFGNEPAPVDHGLSNTATGGKLGQCADL